MRKHLKCCLINNETAENIYEFEIEYEEFSYLLVVKAAHDVEEWDKFMNK